MYPLCIHFCTAKTFWRAQETLIFKMPVSLTVRFRKKLTFGTFFIPVSSFHTHDVQAFCFSRCKLMSNVSQNLTFLRTFLTFLRTHLLFQHTHLLFRYTSVFSIHICFFDTHLLFCLWFLRGILHICYFVTHLLFCYTSVITLHICYFKYLLLRSTHS